jgi:hypothetical protein
MIAKLFDAVFGCWHSRYSFPITTRRGASRSKAAAQTGTYVVCLDCGKELPYDWKQMKIMDATVSSRRPAPALATKEAA